MVFPANISWFFKFQQNHKLMPCFTDYILNTSVTNYFCQEVEQLRKKMADSDEEIEIKDMGAGSRLKLGKRRKISQLAKHSATGYEQGLFINKIVDYFKPANILELGTSLGIGTAYLSGHKAVREVLSIDACEKSQKIARENFDILKLNNIKLINENFDSVFDSEALSDRKFDFIYIDGNHRGSALLKYYQILLSKHSNVKLILLIDDINWSVDMYSAWKKVVKNHPDSCSLNLFRLGIIFINYRELPAGYFKASFI